MTYPYTVDLAARTIRINDDSGIDVARLIAFAQSLESDFPGAYGDDNKGGLMREQRPRWSYQLSVRGVLFKLIVVKTMTLQTVEQWAVVAEPVEPGPACEFESERVEKIYCKHSFSQLADAYFQFEISDRREVVLVRCDWFDSSLLKSILGHVHSKDNGNFSFDTAYRLYFEMAGTRFRVGRNGEELILALTEPDVGDKWGWSAAEALKLLDQALQSVPPAWDKLPDNKP